MDQVTEQDGLAIDFQDLARRALDGQPLAEADLKRLIVAIFERQMFDPTVEALTGLLAYTCMQRGLRQVPSSQLNADEGKVTLHEDAYGLALRFGQQVSDELMATIQRNFEGMQLAWAQRALDGNLYQ